MRKIGKNHFLRRCIAMLLVVSLMGSQLIMPSNISLAADDSQDLIVQEEETASGTGSEKDTSAASDTSEDLSSGGSDTSDTGTSASTSSGTDGSILSIESIEEVTNASSSGESELSADQTEAEIGSANESESAAEPEASALSVAAVLSASAVSNTENEYQVSAAFTVSGSGKETVRLALCMDEITYAILLDSCAAEPETAATDTCVITLTDGTFLTTEKTVLTDGSILLRFAYDADDTGTGSNADTGTMTLEFVLTADADTLEKDVLGTLMAEWSSDSDTDASDAAWSTLDTVSVNWAAVEEECETESESESAAEEIEKETESETEESETESEAETEAETECESETETECETETTGSAIEEDEKETESETEESETECETESESETEDKYAASVIADVTGTAARYSLRGSAGTPAAASVDGTVDLSDYITSATISGYDTVTGEGGETYIENGELVKIDISYKVYSQLLTAAGTDTVTYQLPDGLTPIRKYTGTVYDSGGNEVGAYEISTSGLITITFNDEFISSGNTISGSIGFWSTLDVSGDPGVGEYEFSFSDNDDLTVKLNINVIDDSQSGETEKKSDLYIDKGYNYEIVTNGDVVAEYTIVIGSTNGTGGYTISTFGDTLTNDPSSTLTMTISDGAIVKTDSSEGTEDASFSFDTYFTVSNDGTISLCQELPALEAGDYYTITYKVTYSGFENVNQYVKLQNSAYAGTGNTYNRYDNTEIDLNHTYISKSGKYDSSSDTIIWEITLNDFSADFSGYTFQDILSKDGDSTENQAAGKIITVTEHTSKGSIYTYNVTLPDDGSFKIALGDESSAGTLSDGTLYVYDTTSKIVITYQTDVSDDGFYSEYSNTSTVTDGEGNEHSSGSKDVFVTHDSGILTKEYVSMGEEQKETDESENVISTTKTILWKVTLNSPETEGITSGSYYEDTISATTSGTHYITAAQLSALTVQYLDSYGGSHDFSDEDPGSNYYQIQVKDNTTGTSWIEFDSTAYSETDTFTSFRIYIIKDMPYDSYRGLTLSYYTTADTTEMQDGTVWTFTNKGEFAQEGGSTTSYDSTKESKGGYLIKKDKGGSTSGTYEYDACKGILYYCLTINAAAGNAGQYSTADNGYLGLHNAGTITIRDQLPEGTEIYLGEYLISGMQAYDEGEGLSAGTGSSAIKNEGLYAKLYYNLDGGSMSLGGTFGANDTYGERDINKICSVYIDEDTNELVIEIPEYAYCGEFYGGVTSVPITVYYAVKITDALELSESKEYTNNATMTVGEDEYQDSVTDTVTPSYLSKYINSSAETGDREIAYEVLINSAGATLNGGNDLTLTDTVTYGNYIQAVALKPGSLKLYYLKEDGSKGSEVSTSLYTVTYTDMGSSFVMNITLKDDTPYILDYIYTFTIDDDAYVKDNNGSGSVEITNSISMSGSSIGETSSGTTQTEIADDSYGTADTDGLITIAKVDSKNEIIYLSGANFELQVFESATYTADSEATPGTAIDPMDNKYWTNVRNYVTGQDGTGKVSLYGLEDGCAYRLVEVSAPNNYELTAENYYFYYTTGISSGTEYSILEKALSDAGINDVTLNCLTGGMTVTIQNTASGDDNTSIGIQKYWYDSEGNVLTGSGITDRNGNTVESIEVTLYQTTSKDDTENGTIYSASGVTNPVTISPDDDGNWYYEFTNLPKTNAADETYYYYIKETSATVTLSDGNSETIEPSKSFIITADQTTALASGTVTLSNQKKPTTSVTIDKEWLSAKGASLSGTDITDQDGTVITGIEVVLYQLENTNVIPTDLTGLSEYDTVTVTADANGGWSYTFSELPIDNGYDAADENYVKYYYFAAETGNYYTSGSGETPKTGLTGTDDSNSYTCAVSNTTALNDGSAGSTITITNTKNPGKTSVTVTKAWEGESEGSIDVTLYRSKTAPETEAASTNTKTVSCEVTIKSTGDFYATIRTGDLCVDNDGSTVKITIQLIEGYRWYNLQSEASYSVGGLEAGTVTVTDAGNYTYEIVLSNVNDNITVTVDTDSTYIHDSYFELSAAVVSAITQQQVTGMLELPDDVTEYQTETVTLTSSDSWTYTWQNLSDDYYYYVVEGTGTDGYISGYYAAYEYVYNTAGDVSSGIKEVTITNTAETDSGTTEVTVEKNWKYSDGTAVNDTSAMPSVTLTLWRSTTKTDDGSLPNETEKVTVDNDGAAITNPVTLSDSTWTKTWSNLSKKDSSSNTYYYYVTENTGDYTTEITGNGTTGITVTNTITSISVSKVWAGADGTELSSTDIADKSVSVQLWKKDESGSSDTQIAAIQLANGKTDSGYSNDGWTYTWSALTPGTYYVIETLINGKSSDTGYVTAYTSGTTSADGTLDTSEAANAAVASGTITITNTKESTGISVEKQWSDSKTAHDPVTIYLYRSTTKPTTAGGETEETQAPTTTTTTLSGTISVGSWYYSDDSTDASNAYSGYITSSDSITVTLTNISSGETKSVTLNSANNWSANYSVNGSVDGTTQSYTVTCEKSGSNIASAEVAPSTLTGTTGDSEQNVIVSATLRKDAPSGGGTTEGITIKITSWKDSTSGEAASPLTNEYKSYYISLYDISNNWNYSSVVLTYASGWSGTLSSYEEGHQYVINVGSFSNDGLEVISGTTTYDSSNQLITITDNSALVQLAASYDATASASLTSVSETLTASLTPIVSTMTTASGTGVASSTLRYVSENDTAYASIVLGASEEVDGVSTTSWSYDWSNLPKYDDEGNLYYYYIVEKNVDGYTAKYTYTDDEDDGTISSVTVVNTSTSTEPETMEVTVDKKWVYSGTETVVADEDAGLLADSVTVELYYSTTAPGDVDEDTEYTLYISEKITDAGTAILSQDNDWSYTWSGLPRTGEVNGSEVSYYYYVKETKIGNTDISALGESSSPVYDGNGLAETGTITITNEAEYTSLSVQKLWKDASGTALEKLPSDYSVTLQLYKKGTTEEFETYGTEVTLQASGTADENEFIEIKTSDWTYTWEHLPVGTYYVEETSGEDGYIVSYANTSTEETAVIMDPSEAAVEKGTVTITNQKEPASITVVKTWDDGNSSSRPTEVTVQLYRSTQPLTESESKTEEVTESETETETVTESDTEKAAESEAETETATESETETVTEAATETITTAYMYVTVKVNWVDENGVSCDGPSDGLLWVGATPQNDANTSTYPQGEQWTGNGITEDPPNVYAADGWERKFTVIASTTQGGSTTYYYYRMNCDESVVDYTQENSEGKYGLVVGTVDKDNVDTVILDGSSGVNYTYTITATRSGYYAQTESETEASSLTSASLIVNDHTLTLSSDTGQTGTVAATSVVSSGLINHSDGVAVGDAVPLGNSYAPEEGEASNYGSDGWSYIWSNLDKYDENGNPYYYYVVETSVDDNYTAVYTYETETDSETQETVITQVNIKNTRNAENVSIAVKKEWIGYSETNETSEYEDYTVLLQLNKDETPVENAVIQLNSSNNWSDSETWQNLESGHTYSVTETGVYVNYNTNDQIQISSSNYSVSYTYSLSDGTASSISSLIQSGTITITNTKSSDQGIVLPGTGSKYPLIFYGLGLSFLVVSSTWMLYAFKKKKYKYAGKGGAKPDSS